MGKLSKDSVYSASGAFVSYFSCILRRAQEEREYYQKYTKLASLDHNLQEEGCPHSILKEKSLKVNEAKPYSCEKVMAKKKHKSDTWTEEDELLNKWVLAHSNPYAQSPIWYKRLPNLLKFVRVCWQLYPWSGFPSPYREILVGMADTWILIYMPPPTMCHIVHRYKKVKNFLRKINMDGLS